MQGRTIDTPEQIVSFDWETLRLPQFLYAFVTARRGAMEPDHAHFLDSYSTSNQRPIRTSLPTANPARR